MLYITDDIELILTEINTQWSDILTLQQFDHSWHLQSVCALVIIQSGGGEDPSMSVALIDAPT